MIIEICERLMDRQSDGSPKYHAQVGGNEPSPWGVGNSPAEAVGNLVFCHPEQFGIEIREFSKPQAR